MDLQLEAALQALKDCGDLIEKWIDGPFNNAGVLWNSRSGHPPALVAARKIIADIEGDEPTTASSLITE